MEQKIFGIIKIIGNTNVGKSTLFNRIFSEKISITSKKKNLTNNEINQTTLYNNKKIVYIDTPGIKTKYYDKNLEKIDLINFVLEVTKISSLEIDYINKLKTKLPVVILINKIDKYKNNEILKFINYIKEKILFDEIIPISSKKNININKLQEINSRFILSTNKIINIENTFDLKQRNYDIFKEIIREKIFRYLGEEVPYSILDINLNIKEHKNDIIIFSNIIVKKKTYIKIIVGKNGIKIKQISLSAKYDIFKKTNKKIHLFLYVKQK